MKVRISPGFCAMTCFLAWLNFDACLWFLLAAGLHELGHLLTMHLLRVPLYGLSATCGGAKIYSGFMSDPQEVLCALAGPLTNILLGGFCLRWCSRLAIISFFLAAVNLIPLYPLDGGRILLCVLRRVCAEAWLERVAGGVQFAVCGLLMLLACWACIVLQAGLWPIFAAMILLWRAGNQENLLHFLRREDKMKQSE